jgi:acyl carrier protein
MHNQIKQYLIQLLIEKQKITKEDFESFDHVNFIENKIFDSIELLIFISEIEEHFFIRFLEEELISDNFYTIFNLTTLIQKKINENK